MTMESPFRFLTGADIELLMEKADRVILLGILSLFHGVFDALSWALWILAILTNVTAFHRIYYSYCQIKKLKL